MTPNEIRDHLKNRPFQPFRLHVSDGASYEIRHPEMAWVTLQTIFVARKMVGDNMPVRSVFIDPRHVTRIEPLNGNGQD